MTRSEWSRYDGDLRLPPPPTTTPPRRGISPLLGISLDSSPHGNHLRVSGVSGQVLVSVSVSDTYIGSLRESQQLSICFGYILITS